MVVMATHLLIVQSATHHGQFHDLPEVAVGSDNGGINHGLPVLGHQRWIRELGGGGGGGKRQATHLGSSTEARVLQEAVLCCVPRWVCRCSPGGHLSSTQL